jgi:transitional endoplasmic reticulum ATPase
MRDNAPMLAISDALKNIVAKAIATKPSERYKSIEDFGAAIAKYLGNENLSSFECFAPAHSKPVATPPETTTEDESADIMKQQAPPQPKANVKIERVKGNGFKDVAGMNQLKCKLSRNFVDIVQNRELAAQFQITPPNGILLWGPPGTGKTFISRKLAEESGMLFSLIKPSDLGNIYIHGSQSMIADLFTRSEELAAKNNCGVLLVFDEFDSLVPKRGVNDDNNQANEVAEFLTRLNDCAEKNIFVVATTNRIDAIDPAITRKGRMDEIIYVGLPDEEARKELLEIELMKRPHEDIDTAHIVELTKGYSSSDISFIVKECARCSFEESVKAKHLVKINQALLEKTIAETRPSVTPDELKQFESTNESFSRGQKNERPRIGFVR